MPNETIEVSLGKDSGTKVFNSLEELTNWLAMEQQFWSWLGQHPQTNEKLTILNLFNRFADAVKQQVNEINTLKNLEIQRNQKLDLTQLFKNIGDYFKDFYENQRGIPSETPRGKFLEQLKNEQGHGVACFACGYFMGVGFSYGGYDGFRGATAAYNFDSGSKDSAVSEKQALDELRLYWQGVFQKFENDLHVESEKHRQLNSAAEIQLTSQKENFDQLVSTSKDDWQKLKTTYDDELAIRAPVLYWKSKAKSHLILSWIFAGIAVIIAGTIFTLLYFELKQLIGPPANLEQPELWHPEYWRLAILIASALIGVWMAGIVVRLFLSNMHLQTDAKERVVMVQTYLALLRRGKISKDDEHFILKTLFRPTATGIVKDDAVPLTALDALTKMGKG
ncbi:MAG: DUF6161 domain-containing protein [Verrucomicrobiota bacterium]|jgi:hypothetical protein